MATPQKENGYTPIANEILEQIIKLKLNGTQFRIVMAVWRYTYGYNRKEHNISETFLANAMNTHKAQIAREIKVLIDKKIILVIKESTSTTAKIIAFNKNYDEWVGLQSPDILTVNGLANSGVNGLVNQERNIKENKRKKDLKDICAFFELAWNAYPEKKGKAKVSEKSKRVLFELGFDIVKRCIDRYVASKPTWKEYQHGSTFFNSGYIDYLDENYSEQGEKVKSSTVTPYSGYRDLRELI